VDGELRRQTVGNYQQRERYYSKQLSASEAVVAQLRQEKEAAEKKVRKLQGEMEDWKGLAEMLMVQKESHLPMHPVSRQAAPAAPQAKQSTLSSSRGEVLQMEKERLEERLRMRLSAETALREELGQLKADNKDLKSELKQGKEEMKELKVEHKALKLELTQEKNDWRQREVDWRGREKQLERQIDRRSRSPAASAQGVPPPDTEDLHVQGMKDCYQCGASYPRGTICENCG
jgi:DNA repair exonuclease SbcCD ATPase subunit